MRSTDRVSINPVDVMRKLGGHWPDRELVVMMNRMRCKSGDGGTWTTDAGSRAPGTALSCMDAPGVARGKLI